MLQNIGFFFNFTQISPESACSQLVEMNNVTFKKFSAFTFTALFILTCHSRSTIRVFPAPLMQEMSFPSTLSSAPIMLYIPKYPCADFPTPSLCLNYTDPSLTNLETLFRKPFVVQNAQNMRPGTDFYQFQGIFNDPPNLKIAKNSPYFYSYRVSSPPSGNFCLFLALLPKSVFFQ